MLTKSLRTKLEKFIADNLKNEIAHDYTHLDRTRNWALKIAEQENYKRTDLVEIAALLHDIGLGHTDDRKLHGDVGAEMAVNFLTIESKLTKEDIRTIANAIKNHDKITQVENPNKLLQIIMDADTLELLGAVGIARGISSKAEKPLYTVEDVKGETWKLSTKEFDERFARGEGVGETIIDQLNFQISCFDLLQTNAGRKFAEPLVEYMKNFIRQIESEVLDSKS